MSFKRYIHMGIFGICCCAIFSNTSFADENKCVITPNADGVVDHGTLLNYLTFPGCIDSQGIRKIDFNFSNHDSITVSLEFPLEITAAYTPTKGLEINTDSIGQRVIFDFAQISTTADPSDFNDTCALLISGQRITMAYITVTGFPGRAICLENEAEKVTLKKLAMMGNAKGGVLLKDAQGHEINLAYYQGPKAMAILANNNTVQTATAPPGMPHIYTTEDGYKIVATIPEGMQNFGLFGSYMEGGIETINHIYPGNWNCIPINGLVICDIDALDDWTVRLLGTTAQGTSRLTSTLTLTADAPLCPKGAEITATTCLAVPGTTPAPAPADPAESTPPTGGGSIIDILGGSTPSTGGGTDNSGSGGSIIVDEDGCPAMAALYGLSCAAADEPIATDDAKAKKGPIDTTGGLPAATASTDGGGCSLAAGAPPSGGAWLTFLLPFLTMCGALIIARPRRHRRRHHTIKILPAILGLMLISTSAYAPNRRAFDHGNDCSGYTFPSTVAVSFMLVGVNPDTDAPSTYELCLKNITSGAPSLYVSNPGQLSVHSVNGSTYCYIVTTTNEALDQGTFAIAVKLPGEGCFGKIALDLDAGGVEASVASPDQITTGTVSSGADPSATAATDTSASATTDVQSDTDADGITNAIDNCPDVFNPSQLDLDTDGEGDACDATTSATCVNQIGLGSMVCCEGASGKLYHPDCNPSVDPSVSDGTIFIPTTPEGDAQAAATLGGGCSLVRHTTKTVVRRPYSVVRKQNRRSYSVVRIPLTPLSYSVGN